MRLQFACDCDTNDLLELIWKDITTMKKQWTTPVLEEMNTDLTKGGLPGNNDLSNLGS